MTWVLPADLLRDLVTTMFLQRLLLDTSSLRYLRTFLDWLLDWILGTMVTIACCLLTLLSIRSLISGCHECGGGYRIVGIN